MHASAVRGSQRWAAPQQQAGAFLPCRTGRRAVCLQAAGRKGPEPWDVVEFSQQSTAWQQRQQQQQQQRQAGWQQRRPQRGQQQQQQRNQPQSPAAGKFGSCSTFQALHSALRQHGLQPSQSPELPAADAVSSPTQAAGAGTSKQQQQQQQDSTQQEQQQEEQLPAPPPPPQPTLRQLSAQDCVAVVSQLGAIARSSSSSSSSVSGSGSTVNPFAEDQALQHSLALVYALIEQQQQQQQQPGSSLSAQELLRCVSTLAGLKYTQPLQLGAWLEAAATDQPTPVSSSTAAAGAAAAAPAPSGAAAAGAAGAAGAAAVAGSGSYRQVLAGLRMRELSALMYNLARAGVRPSNVWLLAFMQVAQQKLSSADLQQCAQLLSGLVKVGVKPTTAWLDSMESRAVQCLLEHAVRQQLSTQQQAPAAAAGGGSVRQRQQPLRGSKGSSRSSSSPGVSWQLHHVAALLAALSQARHTPKPQLAAVLWSATGDSLAASDAGALVELTAALGELQLVPSAEWLQQFFAAAGSPSLLQQCRPWQLASTVAAVGKLAAASRASDRQQQQQQQRQQQVAALPGCQAWAEATLAAVQQQLPTFAARDLSALLSGLAALQLQVGARQVQLLLAELQGKLPRLNTAGLADVAEAVVAFNQQQRRPQQQQAPQQQQQQAQQQQGQQGSSSEFVQALLREVAVKLPVFPADDLARVLLAVADSDTRPSHLWLQAVAAQLSSKLTLLQPATLLAVLAALVGMGARLEQQWFLQATAALDGRLLELSGPQLEQLLGLLLGVGVAPAGAWLDQADWAGQQLAQQQEAAGGWPELLLQLRQLQDEQAAGAAAKAASSGSEVGVEVTGH